MQLKEMQTKDPLPAQEMQRLAGLAFRQKSTRQLLNCWKRRTWKRWLHWHSSLAPAMTRSDDGGQNRSQAHPVQISGTPKRVIHFKIQLLLPYQKLPPLSALKQHGFDIHLGVNITSPKFVFHTSKSGTTTALRCGNLDVDAVGHGLSFHRSFWRGQTLEQKAPSNHGISRIRLAFFHPRSPRHPEVFFTQSQSHVGEVAVLGCRSLQNFLTCSCCWCKWGRLNNVIQVISTTHRQLPSNHPGKTIPCLNRLKALLNLALRQPSFLLEQHISDLGVSKNRGTPKWMVCKWKTLLKWMIWGYHYFRKHPFHLPRFSFGFIFRKRLWQTGSATETYRPNLSGKMRLSFQEEETHMQSVFPSIFASHDLCQDSRLFLKSQSRTCDMIVLMHGLNIIAGPQIWTVAGDDAQLVLARQAC